MAPITLPVRARVAFGPVMPGWGSWDWVGADLCEELGHYFVTTTFGFDEVPDADVVVVVKHLPPLVWLESSARRSRILCCPVDYFGSAGDLDAARACLRRCARIVVHCEGLRRYFAAYAPTEYLDHHVKFVTPMREEFRAEGFILWVGVWTNLPSLVEWVNAHSLPGELRVLTNYEDPKQPPSPADCGFRRGVDVRLENWSPERQLRWTAEARAALDIKGQDFRSRHKPPAKAIDFIASGVPLAMNPDSSSVEHLARLGFDVASPEDPAWWLSREYWEETCRFGGAMRELLSRERIGRRLKRIVDAVLAERRD